MMETSIKRQLLNQVLSLIPRDQLVRLFDVFARKLAVDGVIMQGENGLLEGDSRDHGIFRPYLSTRRYSHELIEIVTGVLAPRGGTYFDVGANIGATLIPIAKLPGVECFAFEANPQTFGRLRRNLDRNGVVGTHLFEYAVGSAAGKAEFWLSDWNLGDGRLNFKGNRPQSQGTLCNVSVERADFLVDSVCSLDSLAHPFFVKVDIQGGEPAFLAGAPKLMEHCDHYFTECWPSNMLTNGFDWREYVRQVFTWFNRVDVFRQGHLVIPDATLDSCMTYLVDGAAKDSEFYADLHGKERRLKA